MPIALPAAIIGAAGISAGGSLLGGLASASGANKAAQTQADMFNTINAQEAPFRQFGQAQLPGLGNLLSGNPTQINAQLEQMPGYQFAMTQGLKSVENGAAARGLGVSGAAMKGGAAYATGLASQTYQQQVQNLLQGASLGQNAAANTGYAGTTLAGNQGQYQAGAGSAIGGSLQAATSPFAYALMQQSPFGGAQYGPYGNGAAASDAMGAYY